LEPISVIGVGAVMLVGAGLYVLARRPSDVPDGTEDRAAAAARAAVDNGRVTEVETTTHRGASWEVDVIAPDGTALDVRLDAEFHLLEIAPESDEWDE
jgi:hypothetical protein